MTAELICCAITTHGVDVEVTLPYEPIAIEGVQSPERTQRDVQWLAAAPPTGAAVAVCVYH
jgi:hypothetical protein